ncbi:MerR family transcriptional regulator [Microbacterium sp. PMB16]|uniref:MerR family transcriptional regulator n=1 Tax=Microbacterium sp. PMB16 TaxID=3120157 RepID=UPI003F4CA40C
MKIGEAARMSGVSARSLRHYEDEGLIVPGRRGNGFRDYCPSTIDRVRAVRALRESGLPVRLIRDLLAGSAAAGVGADVCVEFLCEVREYRDRLGVRMEALRDQQAALDEYLREPRRSPE